MECENCKKLQKTVESVRAFQKKIIEQKQQVQNDLNTALKELKELKAEAYKLKSIQKTVKIAKEALDIQLKADEQLSRKSKKA